MASTSQGEARLSREDRPDGRIYHLTISNARRLNVLDSTVVASIGDRLEEVASDELARVLLLTGEGERAWVGGADIREMSSFDRAAGLAFIRSLHEIMDAIRALPVPVIAVIRGYCLGAGLELAACCDLRLADTGSEFGMPEVQVGLPSVIEAALLPRLVGSGRARDLVLTGRVIGTDEALRWGLVDGVAPAGELEALVEIRMGQFLGAAPGAIKAQKLLCRQWEELPLAAAIEAGIEAFGQACDREETRQYLQRFLDRPRGAASSSRGYENE